MYRYRFINKHFQFGQTNYSLILEDFEDGMPTVRIEKSFSMDPTLIDDDFLASQAMPEIQNYTQAFRDAQALLADDADQGDQ